MNNASIYRFRRTFLLCCCIIITVCSLSACSFFKDKPGDGGGKKGPAEPPALLIRKGMEAYNVGNYFKAIEAFEKILNDNPFCPEAMLAELKAADAHYYDKSYEEAKLLYQEFEERHPTNEAIPYVIFQIGMCNFVRAERIDRDISGAQEAIRTFSRLLRTYPDSPYTEEAQGRIRAAKEFLVNHEYYVAVFYVRTKRYKQAQHRLKYLITMYPDSDITPKAKKLFKRLNEGNPPKWGLSKWLPNLDMPSWQ